MDDPAAVRALLAPTSNGRTLITARQALEWVPAGQHVRLGPLPSPASLSVLVNRLPTGNDAEQRLTILREDPCELISARRVAEQLGHHPLSLAVAAALIGRDEALTFHALDQRLASHDSELLTLAENLGALLPTGHAASIATTLWLSVQSLPGVGAALGLLSELAAAPVPLQLIEDVVAGVNGLPPEEARRVVLDEWSSTS